MLWAIAVVQAVSFFGGAMYALVAWIRERPDPEIEERALMRSLSWALREMIPGRRTNPACPTLNSRNPMTNSAPPFGSPARRFAS
jgi:hypothetical protein